MSTPLDLYLRVLAGVAGVANASAYDRWDAASPCPDWSARQLLGHLIDGQRQVVAMVTGQGPRPPISDPEALGQLAGDAPPASWTRAHDHTVEALRRHDLAETVVTPLGERAVHDVLSLAMIEPLVHAWDLAVATGQTITLDPEAVATTLPGVRALGDQLQATGMYQPAHAVPLDAPDQDRLLAALGRDPSTGTFR